jgi:very-short-patch-repair endonuclease
MCNDNCFSQWNEISYFEEFKEFDNLCLRAKLYLWDWILNDEGNVCGLADGILNSNILNSKLTPIEQIWNVCYTRYIHNYLYKNSFLNEINKEYHFVLPINVAFLEFAREQEKIEAKEKNYIADFELNFSYKFADEYIFPLFKDLKYIVELDGFDYHNNKNQMNYDYDRQQNLQLLGYKVMRFTGSQIYNAPYDCIHKFFTMVINDMKKEYNDGRKRTMDKT